MSKDDTSFTDFVCDNREAIHKVVDANTPQNTDGVAIIKKDDPWRKETEWDDLYKKLKDK